MSLEVQVAQESVNQAQAVVAETTIKPKRGRKPTINGPTKMVAANISEDVYNKVVSEFPSVTTAVRAVFDFYVANRK